LIKSFFHGKIPPEQKILILNDFEFSGKKESNRLEALTLWNQPLNSKINEMMSRRVHNFSP
jgi:hypothetical protein